MASAYQSIAGCFDFEDVYELALRRCGTKRAKFVEVGADKGRSTCYLAERVRENRLCADLHVIDTFAGDDADQSDLWPQFAGNLARASVLERLTAQHQASPQAAQAFADELLDFVFITARHTFEALCQNLAAWWPKLRPGALIAGRDSHDLFAVKAAVDHFVTARGLSHASRSSASSWMIYRSLRVDAAYCINLPRRADRRRNASAQFEAAGLTGNVTFSEAVDGAQLAHPGVVSDGQAGCCLSHLRVLRTAREKGHSHVLVFEDDIELASDFRAKFASALSRCPASYDLCYVGALCKADWGNYLYPFDGMLSRVGSVRGTHAYIVNLERLDAIEAGLRDLRSVIDDWYARELQPRGDCYAFTPWLGFQASGWSDVAGTFNDNGSQAGYVWR